MKSDFNYELIRSKRKTLGIKITKDAQLVVMAPKSMKIKDIEVFLAEKSDWIEKNILKMQGIKEKRGSFSIDENSMLLFYGKEYPLIKYDGKKAGFDGECFYIPKDIPKENIVPTVKEIYRMLAKSYLVKRTCDLAEYFGENINSVKINSARTRWGSCSSKRNINLSLYLIMASPDAVDYCIIHELCHLKHMDHSKSFWALVEMRDPEYKAHEKELKELGKKLALENF